MKQADIDPYTARLPRLVVMQAERRALQEADCARRLPWWLRDTVRVESEAVYARPDQAVACEEGT